jgi:lysophospholipase L1-like esterase
MHHNIRHIIAPLLLGTVFASVYAQEFATPEPEPWQELKAVPAVAKAPGQVEAWVRTPEERAWENILEASLGNEYYLPKYKKAKAKGLETSWDYIKDNPALPRILLIGDSISDGYTMPVRHALAGKVNVHRAPMNCGSTSRALSTNLKLNRQQLEIWLDDGRWDLIHFNFGIHDQRGSVEEYVKNLEQIVKRLKQTGAKLIFANITCGRDAEDKIIELNRAAAEVMARNNVPINDLYSYMQPRKLELRIAPDNSHFCGPGSSYLGGKVAEEILKQLGKTF